MDDSRDITRRASRFGDGESPSADSSGSEADEGEGQDGSRKRKRPMNITYAFPPPRSLDGQSLNTHGQLRGL